MRSADEGTCRRGGTTTSTASTTTSTTSTTSTCTSTCAGIGAIASHNAIAVATVGVEEVAERGTRLRVAHTGASCLPRGEDRRFSCHRRASVSQPRMAQLSAARVSTSHPIRTRYSRHGVDACVYTAVRCTIAGAAILFVTGLVLLKVDLPIDRVAFVRR